MVSLPLIKIYGFSLWIILLDVEKKLKSLVVAVKQCSPLGFVSPKAKGSPNQLLLNLASKKPLTTRGCYFFYLMNGDFTKGVFIVLLERMSTWKHKQAFGALSGNGVAAPGFAVLALWHTRSNRLVHQSCHSPSCPTDMVSLQILCKHCVEESLTQ